MRKPSKQFLQYAIGIKLCRINNELFNVKVAASVVLIGLYKATELQTTMCFLLIVIIARMDVNTSYLVGEFEYLHI